LRNKKIHNKSLLAKITGIIVGIVVVLLYSSCNNSTNNSNTPPDNFVKGRPKPSLIKILLGDGRNLFRSVNLGTDFKTALGSEQKIPDENDTDDISYTFPIDTLQPDSINEPIDSVNYFKITYYFHKEKLNEIDEDIYLESDSSAAILLNRLTEYLSLKYNDYTTQNDSRIWSLSNKGKKEWVSLSDQSEEYDNGKLQLVFYSEDI
jgi:hypothetical protein